MELLINENLNLPAWTSYEGLNNVLSYENESSYSAISNDISFTLSVTTIGCVEEIVLDAHPTSGYCGTFTVSSNCQSCNANVGTISVDINGSNVSGTDVDIPYGETATFNSAGYTLPNDGPAGTAGMVLALFSCDPEAASLISPFDIQNDPCYLGIAASDNVSTNNDGTGTSTYGEVWAVFMTFDHAANDGGPDTDADDCVDVSGVFHITYLPENPPSSTDCGSCLSPNCLIAGPYTDFNDAELFSNHCSQMNNYELNPITSSTHTTFHSVTSSSDGSIGMIITLKEGGPTNPCGITKVAKLYPAGNNCLSGSAISATTTTANGSQFYNPEWSGLTPNASYILEIQFTIPNGCELVDHCESFYYPNSTPSVGCGDCSSPGCPIYLTSDGSASTSTYPSSNHIDYNSFGPTSDGFGPYIETQCHTITIPSNGTTLGIRQSIYQLSQGCANRTYELKAADGSGQCTGSAIPVSTQNGGNSMVFNPEWDNLNSGNYVLCITFDVPDFCDIDYTNTGYYLETSSQPPNPGPCEIQNGSVTTCDCEFTDSGGSTGDYGADENSTFTICPDQADASIQLDFSSFESEDGFDFMYIYDGNSVTGSPIISVDGSNPIELQSIISASLSNSSGCLTIVFESNSSNQSAGWIADVSCSYQCQNPVANATVNGATTPTVKICIGDEVSFDASSSVSNANSIDSYVWDFGNLSTGSSITENVIFNNPGRYVPSLIVENDEGCTSNNALPFEILVSTEAIFSGTTPNQSVCLGGEICLDGEVNFLAEGSSGITPTSEQGEFGTGDQFYESTLVIDGYSPGQTITSASDLLGVCVNMEHSAEGDVSITLISPSGQEISLHSGGLTAAVLGIPSLDANAFVGTQGCNFGGPASGPGTGWWYCFNTSGSETLANHGNNNWSYPSGPLCYQIPEGDYLPTDPFSNLIGADLNGAWTLRVEDATGNDNGHLFSWYLNFDPSLSSSGSSISPSVVTQSWTGPETIVSNNDDVICVSPDFTGTNVYTFSVTNDFGCVYDTTISIEITGPITNTIDTVICNGASLTFHGTVYNAIKPSGNHSFETANGCDSIVTINVLEAAPITSLVNEEICIGGSYSYYGQIYDANNPNGTIFLQNGAVNGCDSTISFSVTEVLIITHEIDSVICNGGSYEYQNTVYDANNPTGTHSFVTDLGCDSIVTFSVTESPAVTSVVSEIICYGESFNYYGDIYDANNPSGTEVLVGASVNGCDSIVSFSIIESTEITNSVNEIICHGSSFNYYGDIYDANNSSGTKVLSASNGCDSVVSFSITESPQITSIVNEVICYGSSYNYNGTVYDANNSSGTEIISASSGCDSVVSFSIVESLEITNIVDSVICNGTSVNYHGVVYDVSNPTGIAVLTASDGCDSTVTFSVTETVPISSIVNEAICFGSSFNYYGTIYDSSNQSGTEVLISSSGCDSTVSFSITESNPIENTITPSICANDTFNYQGTIYDINNTTGSHILQAINGCDSTVTVSLGINNLSSSILDTSVCHGDYITINGNVYDSINPTGKEILVSSLGCDSTVSINLEEIIPDTSFIDTLIYVGQTFDIAGEILVQSDFEGLVYVESLLTGCDSIISAKIRMLNESVHYVPTGFSPNNDGNNDFIGVMGGGISEINFYIYNRWGERIFTYEGPYEGFCPEDPTCQWDGTYNNQPLNVETYVYYLKGVYVNGEEFTDKGTISLIK